MEREWMRRVMEGMVEAVRETALRLDGCVVMTEAATGPFAVTPVIAALAGARRVLAVGRDTRFGTASEAFAQVERLAEHCGLGGRIEYGIGRRLDWFAQADIVTNSGHVRPIDDEAVGHMRPTCVVPLMYEGWEWRPEDVSLASCNAKGIAVAGVWESHPAVGVFDYLGPALLELMGRHDIRPPQRACLVCDNPFERHLLQALKQTGANVEVVRRLLDGQPLGRFDLVVLALKPEERWALGDAEALALAEASETLTIVQFWGDVDRRASQKNGLSVVPTVDPGRGRMGILLSELGPEPAIRLQTGGLKVGEVMATARRLHPGPDGMAIALQAALASGFGMLPS